MLGLRHIPEWQQGMLGDPLQERSCVGDEPPVRIKFLAARPRGYWASPLDACADARKQTPVGEQVEARNRSHGRT